MLKICIKMIRRIRCYSLLKRMRTFRYFLLICCFSVLGLLWIQSDGRDRANINDVFERVHKKAGDKDLKYILLWTPNDYSPFYFLGNGQEAFIKNNCSVTNCYVTSNKLFFGSDTTGFDAIAFNGRNLKFMQLPKKRSPHQKYIYFNLESSYNYPVCNRKFDGFFNWTATYKLNSDIPTPYFVIKDRRGKPVGPKRDMHWISNMTQVDKDFSIKLSSKKKAAAWFVSACSERSGRREFAINLQRGLMAYGHTVDIFGACGTMSCPIENKTECNSMLERHYFFYLALENSFGEDYVSEKLLTALQHDTVPIVYGAADYSRFLPPGSYLDARKQRPEDLAATMAQLIASPDLYRQFFKWKQHYTYHDATATDNVCAVCEALNNKTMVESTSSYQNFRWWWNPLYKERCWWMEDIAFNRFW